MECLQSTFNSPSLRCIIPKRRRHKIKPFGNNKVKSKNKKMDNENQTSEANLLKAAAECLEKAVPMDTDEQKTHFRTVEEITSYWNQELDKVYL